MMANRDISTFEDLFRTYFVPLTQFCMKFTNDLDESKEIVHKVFIKVWEKYQELPEDMNFKSYLYTSVNNYGLNYIRDHKKFVELDDAGALKTNPERSVETDELERSIELAIETLPDRCREVFELSRFEGLSYGEIAENMGISVKTVEAQMSKALRLLRTQLSDYLVLLFILLCQG